jgi:hypothetical protein
MFAMGQSATIESLETYKTIHSYGCGMGIKVSVANGTAKSLIAPDNICETLAPFDGALLTPRALWEFQGFRLQYHCRVPRGRKLALWPRYSTYAQSRNHFGQCEEKPPDIGRLRLCSAERWGKAPRREGRILSQRQLLTFLLACSSGSDIQIWNRRCGI